MKRAALILGAVLALLATLPAGALAHATLEQTTPGRGAVAQSEPRQVVLRFDESVEGNFGAVRVFDARGDRVDDGPVTHPGGTGAKLAVGLKPGLKDGTYTTTYRVISADSHPVSGGFVFSIVRAGAAPAETVGDLLAGSSTGRVTEGAFGIARGADYLAIALVLGTLAFILLAWPRGAPIEAEAAFARRTRTLLLAGAAIGVLSGAAGIVLQGATAGGTTFWTALDPGTVREVLGTRFGTVWGLRVVDFVALGALALAVGPPRRGNPWLYALPAAFLALTPALGGHATTQHPVALLAPLDVVHVLAMSAWVGGLVVLVLAVPAATRAIGDAAARTPLLASTLSRFSAVALTCVGLLIASGTAQSIVHLRSFGDFLHTAFGRAVLIKIIILLALIGLGALNRRRSVPRLRAAAAAGATPGAAGRVLRTTLRVEVGLVVVVLAVTAALVSYAPPSALSAGPYSHATRTGPLEIEMTVDPARAGINAMHLYVFAAKDGAPFDGTKELTVDAQLKSKGIGPLHATLHRAGPGHYVADAMTLAPGGTWTVTVTDRVSDFDEYAARFEVPVQ
ncbi:Copper transport protein YcnJ [Baekduia alba]|uniref:copper resistance CopC/CopD family protein n=1 Tax=Baekduia alba TaxID=2997333 RepID=UPI002340C15A|nr:copper resistance protein CopC [Baekduia alba]WCB91898.1 Copper transport protein YcnJ [Baekduia alba]